MATSERITLEMKIRRRLFSRLICLLAIIVGTILYLTLQNIYINFDQNEKRIESMQTQLGEFVASQSFFGNSEQIYQALAQIAKSNHIEISFQKKISKINESIHFVFPWYLKSELIVKDFQNNKIGTLTIRTSIFNNHNSIISLAKQVIFLLVILFVVFFLIFPLFWKLPNELILAPINELLILLDRNVDATESGEQDSSFDTSELNEIKKRIVLLLEMTRKDSRSIAVGQIARQVAHDIRLPIAALNIMIKNTKFEDQDEKELLKNAVKRINSIANNLIVDNVKDTSSKNANNDMSLCLIFPLIETIIMEKQIETKGRVAIVLNGTKEIKSIFCHIVPSTFQRILSNIINNSIDAFDGDAKNTKIVISLRIEKNQVVISIADNGCGIPCEIQTKIFDYGFTHGKSEGTGLGLSYSNFHIKDWGGTLNAESTVGTGTTLTLSLPIAETPEWILTELTLPEELDMIILDDTKCIYDAWKNKIKSIKNFKSAVITHIKDPDQFIVQEAIDRTNAHRVYIIDYEFEGHNMTGVDIINKYCLEDDCILFTANYDNKNIQQYCQKNNVLLLPKQLFEELEIFPCVKKPDAILIDDDIYLGQAWRYHADFNDKDIAYFPTTLAFKFLATWFDKETAIFIDSNLGSGHCGEVVSKEIYDSGYKSIYLATGYNPDFITRPFWIKKIVDKQIKF